MFRRPNERSLLEALEFLRRVAPRPLSAQPSSAYGPAVGPRRQPPFPATNMWVLIVTPSSSLPLAQARVRSSLPPPLLFHLNRKHRAGAAATFKP
jgi:hypothetical protein